MKKFKLPWNQGCFENVSELFFLNQGKIPWFQRNLNLCGGIKKVGDRFHEGLHSNCPTHLIDKDTICDRRTNQGTPRLLCEKRYNIDISKSSHKQSTPYQRRR